MDRNPENPMIRIDKIVALRKESVDRNLVRAGFLITLGGSLSARRAWIEITSKPGKVNVVERRSPQGERG